MTLIELIIACAILLILAGAALPIGATKYQVSTRSRTAALLAGDEGRN